MLDRDLSTAGMSAEGTPSRWHCRTGRVAISDLAGTGGMCQAPPQWLTWLSAAGYPCCAVVAAGTAETVRPCRRRSWTSCIPGWDYPGCRPAAVHIRGIMPRIAHTEGVPIETDVIVRCGARYSAAWAARTVPEASTAGQCLRAARRAAAVPAVVGGLPRAASRRGAAHARPGPQPALALFTAARLPPWPAGDKTGDNECRHQVLPDKRLRRRRRPRPPRREWPTRRRGR